MYYKDNNIEIRLGLGIKDFKKFTATEPTFVLIRIIENEPDVIVSTFTTVTELSNYPEDGTYKIQVTIATIPIYNIYITINDNFFREFIKQVEEIICKCNCDDTPPCGISKACNKALKRQRMFNMMSILPYTIKPFLYGQSSINNPVLSNFFQAYYNEALSQKMTELGKEYFDYYIKGTNKMNSNLFKEIVAVNYYVLYYYSRKYLLTNAGAKANAYIKTIDTFFDLYNIKECLGCSTIKGDIEAIMNGEVLPPVITSNIYYWQLALGETMVSTVESFTEATLVDKPNKTLIEFSVGVTINYTNIGRAAFAITNTPLQGYDILDTVLNTNVTNLFDMHYFESLDILLYTSKVPYSISTLKLKIKKQTP